MSNDSPIDDSTIRHTDELNNSSSLPSESNPQIQNAQNTINALDSFISLISEITTLDQLYRVLYQHLAATIGECNMFLALYDSHKKEISIPYAVEDGSILQLPTMPLGKGLVSKIIETRSPVLHNEEKNSHTALSSITSNRIQSWLGVPLLLNRKPIGALVLQDPKSGLRFTEQDKQLLVLLAKPLVNAIQSLSKIQTLKQQLDHQFIMIHSLEEQQQKITNLTEHLHDTLDIDLVLQIAAVEIREAFDLAEVEIHINPTV